MVLTDVHVLYVSCDGVSSTPIYIVNAPLPTARFCYNLSVAMEMLHCVLFYLSKEPESCSIHETTTTTVAAAVESSNQHKRLICQQVVKLMDKMSLTCTNQRKSLL